MFLAIELQTSRVDVPSHLQGLFIPSKLMIRYCKIALRDEYAVFWFVMKSNLAASYQSLGRREEALQIERDVYSVHLKLDGEEHARTLLAATNYADSLKILGRFEEAKALLRKTIPIARRVLGESNTITFDMRWTCAVALYRDPGATLDDLREAMTTLDDTERIARRVLGGAHPTTAWIENNMREARAALRAHAATLIGRIFLAISRRREKLATVDGE